MGGTTEPVNLHRPAIPIAPVIDAGNYNGYSLTACYCTDKPIGQKFPLYAQKYTNFTQKLSRAHWLAFWVGMICVVLQVTGLQETLRFSRSEIMDGQWWRLLTGNLVHLGYAHLLLNLAGLAVITALLAPSMNTRQWLVTGVTCMAGVGIGLLAFDPHLHWYVGLSGVLYGLLLGGAIAEFRQQRLFAVIIAGYTVGKIIWEQLYGAVESSEKITGGNVIVNAHLYGMVAGGVAVIALLGINYLLGVRKQR